MKNIKARNLLPDFYLEVFSAFNQCKYVKKLNCTNDYDFLSQPIWLNEIFKFKGKTV